eukprot:390402_1
MQSKGNELIACILTLRAFDIVQLNGRGFECFCNAQFDGFQCFVSNKKRVLCDVVGGVGGLRGTLATKSIYPINKASASSVFLCGSKLPNICRFKQVMNCAFFIL